MNVLVSILFVAVHVAAFLVSGEDGTELSENLSTQREDVKGKNITWTERVKSPSAWQYLAKST